MSIQIDKKTCIGCGRCTEACPGNLIRLNEEKKAEIRILEDCWGCTSCMKVCPAGAIRFRLGADIGGTGAYMTYKKEGHTGRWTVFNKGSSETIEVDDRSSNKY